MKRWKKTEMFVIFTLGYIIGGCAGVAIGILALGFGPISFQFNIGLWIAMFLCGTLMAMVNTINP